MFPALRRTLAAGLLLTTTLTVSPFGALPAVAQRLPPPDSVTGAAPAVSHLAGALPAEETPKAKRWYQGNLLKAVAVPAVLIGYGISVRGDRGFYSSHDARRDLRREFGNFSSSADDILLLVPYAELAALALFKVPERHDRFNTSLLVLKSTAIAAATFTTIKYAVRDPRPDGSDNLSFPSGHTTIAFCAASLVHQEFRARSQWPGIGAYAVATSVAAMRMLNDRHWQADVLTGAGIGILSVHAAYLTHRYRWGRRPEEGPGSTRPKVGRTTVSPWGWPGRGVGLTCTVQLR